MHTYLDDRPVQRHFPLGHWEQDMGWRTDQAYEDAQKADFAAWKASLTWPQYLGALIRSYRSALAGAAVSLVMAGILWLIIR